jgi:NAD(P)-dependent dehydrogenase (short-subunit alcohol dehydrogenase family)
MESFTKFAGLDGAVALVTGGATGIGSAIVENFLRQGSRVVFLDKNAEAGRELVARLTDGAKTIPEFVCAELTDLHSLKGATESIERRAGPSGPGQYRKTWRRWLPSSLRRMRGRAQIRPT